MAPDLNRRVREIIADVTLMPVERVGEDAAAGRLEGWDSLAQVNIIVAVETAFDVSFNAEEVHALNSAAKIVGALQRAGLKS
jgi:acyl carrier protein